MKKILKICLVVFILIAIVLGIITITNAEGETETFNNDYYPWNIKIKHFSADDSYLGLSYIIDSNDNLYAFGTNYTGGYGNGTYQIHEKNVTSYKPTQVMQGTKFETVATNGYSTLAIDKNGDLWGWGDTETIGNGASGDITTDGLGNERTCKLTPERIKSGTKFKEIAMGLEVAGAIDTNGNLWITGRSVMGTMGDGTKNTSTTFKNIKPGTKFSKISIGFEHIMALDVNGNLWTWGSNEYGAVGNNGEGDNNYGVIKLQTTPVQILPEKKFTMISAGGYSSYAVDTDGNLWAWGCNEYGQLGLGTETEKILTPKSLYEDLIDSEIASIQGGKWHLLVLDTTGRVFGCGAMYSNPTALYGESDEYLLDSYLANNTSTVNGHAALNLLYRIQYQRTFSKIMTGGSLACSTMLLEENSGDAWASKIIREDIGIKKSFIEDESFLKQITKDYYLVDLKTNGGTINSGNIVTYDTGVGATLPKDITRENYRFDGWYDNQECTGTAITRISTTDTGNKTFYAKWTSTLTESSIINVNYYLQKTDLQTYEYTAKLESYEQYYYPVGSEISAPIKEFEGFEVNPNKGQIKGIVAPNGGLTLEVYYDRKQYNVTLNTNGGTINSGNVSKYTYGIVTALPTDVTKAGYVFGGWTNGSITTNSIYSNNIGDLTFEAKWYSSDSTLYKEEFYKENDNGEYELYEYNYKEGKTDANVTAGEKEYVGYVENTNHPDRVETGTIAGDGSLVLKRYYSKKLDTPYKVVYYKQKVNLVGYEEDTNLTKNLTGKTDTEVTVEAEEIPGFTENTEVKGRITKAKINGNGTTTLALFYDRNQYNVTLNTNGGTIKDGNFDKYVYGENKTLPQNVEKPGYVFDGWYDNEQLDGERVTQINDTDMEDKTYYAKWTAKNNVKYVVEYYLQDIGLRDYELSRSLTEEKYGTTEEEVIAESKEIRGFTENTSTLLRKDTGNIKGDGSLVLALYYDRNQYSINYNVDGGTINDQEYPTDYIYGIGNFLPQNIEKPGYTFGGWFTTSDYTGGAIKYISQTDEGDKEVFAKWLVETDITYKTEYYKQNLSLDGYVLDESLTEERVGATGESVTAIHKELRGFTENISHANKVETGTIAGDGSLVLKLYYDRNNYNLTLNTNGGTINNGNISNYYYGTITILPLNITKPGYTFAGWYSNDKFTGIAVTKISATNIGDKTYFAKWTPRNDTKYRVEHYMQKLDGTYELLAENVEEKTGRTNSLVTANAKQITGFIENVSHIDRINSGIIEGEENLVLKLFYDRKKYSITYCLNNGIINETYENIYKFGEEKDLPVNVTKDGYIFRGWYKDSNCLGDAQTKILSSDTENKVFYAKWEEEANVNYTIEYYKEDTNGNYVQAETVVKQGKTDSIVYAEVKNYEGYVENSIHKNRKASGIVLGDGSLILRLYYDKEM